MKLHPNNPRKITDEKLKMLEKSLKTFGDISGIVHNKRTGNIFGGNQRAKIIGLKKPTILTNYIPPTELGTMAEGFIEFEGERFSYRQVDWDQEKETTAMIAANNQGGKNDFATLTEYLIHLDGLNVDTELAGFSSEEMEKLMAFEDFQETEKPALGDKTATLTSCPNCGADL